MKFYADFHIHSRYSRATSPEMDLDHIAEWAKYKGLGLVGTGDFTHPAWFRELKLKLEPRGNGLFHYKGVDFILTAEVSNIFSKNGRTRKIHNLVFAPSLEAAGEVNRRLRSHASLEVDGRPILPIYASRLVELVLKADPANFVVPAHIWTPHFSLFGSNSGFDAIEECYEDQTEHIFALETGLSSDPPMNWRLSALDRFSLISNSDCHSPAKLGREANAFDCELDYAAVREALRAKDRSKFLYTIEFFPEEGKYHYDGHKPCAVRMTPAECKRHKNLCPKCGKKATVGVLHRVDDLADRPEDEAPAGAIPCKHLIPLEEIIAAAKDMGTGTQTVLREYHKLITTFGSEFSILLETPESELVTATDRRIAEGIMRVRAGRVRVLPGYDGEYGEIRVFEEPDLKLKDGKGKMQNGKSKGKNKKQMELF